MFKTFLLGSLLGLFAFLFLLAFRWWITDDSLLSLILAGVLFLLTLAINGAVARDE